MQSNNQLILKNIGYINPGAWLQNEDFRYNIRGWLLSINNSKLTPDGGKTNNDNNDVFGMQLMYDKPDSSSNLINSVKYDGRPTGIKWMTRNYSNTRTRERSFLYYYDGFASYTGESYAERDSTSTGANPYNINRGAFNETSIAYDVNGNVTKLSRNSSNPAGGFYQIDTLAYTYNTTNANQLLKVTDGTDTVHTNHGFRSIDSTANYSYDGNGNLYNDHFKGLELRYDVLNRTDKITVTTASGRYIDYTYDADGNLLRKRAYSGGTLQTTTDYVDGFVYIKVTTGTPALSYFPMPEGRVVNVSGTLTQEFIMTDQQGNARVAFRNVGGIAKVYQENSYYGTGLILPNSPVYTPAVANKKLYNGGSEWQNDSPSGTYNLPDYYQTFNRNYDAAIGRWISVDPKAENTDYLSAYQYGNLDPIIHNDPNGDISNEQWKFALNQFTNGIKGNYDIQEGGPLYTELSDEQAKFMYGDNTLASGGGSGGSTGNGSYYVDSQGWIAPASNSPRTPAPGTSILYASITAKIDPANQNFIVVDNNAVDLSAFLTVPGTITQQYLVIHGNQQATALFEFLSQNTSVEWSLVTYNVDMNDLSTSHDAGHEHSINNILALIWSQGGIVSKVIHDHNLDEGDIAIGLFGPSGFRANDQDTRDGKGDKAWYLYYYYPSFYQANQSNSIQFFVYDVYTNHYYGFDETNIYNDISKLATQY